MWRWQENLWIRSLAPNPKSLVPCPAPLTVGAQWRTKLLVWETRCFFGPEWMCACREDASCGGFKVSSCRPPRTRRLNCAVWRVWRDTLAGLRVYPSQLIAKPDRVRVARNWPNPGFGSTRVLLNLEVDYCAVGGSLALLSPGVFMAGSDLQDCPLRRIVPPTSWRFLEVRHPVAGRSASDPDQPLGRSLTALAPAARPSFSSWSLFVLAVLPRPRAWTVRSLR